MSYIVKWDVNHGEREIYVDRLRSTLRRTLELATEAMSLAQRETILPTRALVGLTRIAQVLWTTDAVSTRDPQRLADVLNAMTFDLFVILRMTGLRLADKHARRADPDSGESMSNLALLFRQEARRQTVVASHIVNGMLTMPTSYIPEAAADNGVDRKGLQKLLDLLKTEQEKLDANEATIAVLGAMKAGKSTSINAIVGSEVLPSREQPMTTFPTIVTHVPGCKDGILSFPLATAFRELAKAVEQSLTEHGEALDDRLANAAAAEPLRTLATQIQSGEFAVADEASGLENIRRLLSEVNDLTRLARHLGVADDCVANTLSYDNLPRIQIEFEHLVTTPGTFSGTLSLVDTPGPNEFGSSVALEEIARQQLSDASAIILVVEFSQVGSEADARVKELLSLLPEGGTDRLFTFINKFDAAKKHGDNLSRAERAEAEAARIDEYRAMTARQIVEVAGEGSLELLKARTFPTSADMALLSNQARRAVRLDGRLSPKFAWVENFADRRLPDWELDPEVLSDPVRLEQAISGGWTMSRFGEPLEHAISYSAANASKLLVMACLDKMREGMGQVYERLGLGRNALEADTAAMIETIQELSDDLSAIRTVSNNNQEIVESVRNDLSDLLDVYQSNIADSIADVIDAYSKAGSAHEAQRRHSLIRNLSISGLKNVLGRIRKTITGSDGAEIYLDADTERLIGENLEALKLPDSTITPHPDTNRPSIKLAGTSLAASTAEAIYTPFEDLLAQGFKTIIDARNTAIHQVVGDTRDTVRASFQVGWKKVRDRMQELIDVDLEQPELEIPRSFSFRIGPRGAVISTRREMVEADGIDKFFQRRVGWFAGLFEFDTKHWGREEKAFQYIDLSKLQMETSRKLGELKAMLAIDTDDKLNELERLITQYASELAHRVEQLQRYLEEEKIARESDVENYEVLRQTILALSDQADDLRQEAQSLRLELAA